MTKSNDGDDITLSNTEKDDVMVITLNTQQAYAKDDFIDWYNHPDKRKRNWYEISGPAGSGKTTIVRHIIDELGFSDNEVAFVAYTGKAALALRLSGVPGRTVHSMVYELTVVNAREDGNLVYVNGRPKTKMVFTKKDKLDPDLRLLVVDEGGMVETTMAQDLLSFGIPLLVLGDLHQLPPVFGNGIFLSKPDVVLTMVMRQAEDSPILYIAKSAIYHMAIQYGVYGNNDEVLVIRKDKVFNSHELIKRLIYMSDMIICGTNNLRDMLNKYIRLNIQGIDSNTVTLDDKLICRQNHWDIMLGGEYDDIALVNGIVGYCTGINKNPKNRSSYMEMDFRPEFSVSRQFIDLPIDHKYLFANYEKRKQMAGIKTDNILFEFGSVITCHLAQGSQADTVLVFVENWSDSDYFWKWLYTAVTRAKKKLILVM